MTDYRVICFYRPPGFDNESYTYLCESVKFIQGLCSTDRLVVIMGDFNLPCIDWSITVRMTQFIKYF